MKGRIKKFLINILFYIFLIGAIALISIFTWNKVKKENTIQTEEQVNFIDLTNIPENEVFFTNALDYYDFSAYRLNLNSTLVVNIVDENANPIPEGKIKIYDEDGYALFEVSANKDGRIALSNFEVSKKYYLKQSATREGLTMSTKLFNFTLESDNANNKHSFSQTIVSTDREVSKEEEKNLEKIYEENLSKQNRGKNLDEISSSYLLLSNEEIQEKNTILTEIDTYRLLYQNLYRKELSITKYPSTRVENISYKKYVPRIKNTQILNSTEEKINDENNIVEIVDSNKNPKNYFENGEGFYLKYDKAADLSNIEYKLTITLKYFGDIYKITKTIK